MLRKYPIAADITIITGKGTFSRCSYKSPSARRFGIHL